MKITFLGHACFLIENKNTSIIIDPFYDEEKFDPRPNYVVATHGHFDHFKHAEKLCTAGAKFVGMPELCKHLESRGAKNVHSMNIGGFFDFGDFKLKLVQAMHSSSIDFTDEKGCAVGCIIEIDGKIIYHAGDTGLFGDMELIGKRHKIDIAMLPIGGNYTMGVDDAVYACNLLKPKIATPMHYNTFPIIKADSKEFIENLPSGTKGLIFEPGESKEF